MCIRDRSRNTLQEELTILTSRYFNWSVSCLTLSMAKQLLITFLSVCWSHLFMVFNFNMNHQARHWQIIKLLFSCHSHKVRRNIINHYQVLVFNEPLAWTLTENFNHIYCQTHIQTLHEKFSFDFWFSSHSCITGQ